MADFRKLEVWQKAHSLVLSVNDVADTIRGAEYTSLRSQIVRAVMSIDANIVEGRNQPTDRKFAQYVRIAINSANELEAHLIMARDIGAMKAGDYARLREQLIQVRKMLHGLANRLLNLPKSSEPAAD
ncbi:MAG TPA: four helix bundle protein [Gemmatimonadaceae bacterium]